MNKKYYHLLFLGLFIINCPLIKTTIQYKDIFQEYTDVENVKEAKEYYQFTLTRPSYINSEDIKALESYKNFQTKYGQIELSDSINYKELAKNNDELLNLGQQLNEWINKFSLKLEKMYYEMKDETKNSGYYTFIIKFNKNGATSDGIPKNISDNSETPQIYSLRLVHIESALERFKQWKNLPKEKMDIFPVIKIPLSDVDNKKNEMKIMQNFFSFFSKYNVPKVEIENFYNNLILCVYNSWMYRKIISKVNDLDESIVNQFRKYTEDKVNFFINEDKKKYELAKKFGKHINKIMQLKKKRNKIILKSELN